MAFSLTKSTVKVFNYTFSFKEVGVLFFGYLLMENIFSWLVVPNSNIVLMYEKLTSLFIYGFMLYKFRDLDKTEKVVVALFTVLMIRLIFESLIQYGSVFQQFTMYTVLFPVIFVVFIRYLCRSMTLDILEFLAQFYLFTYIAFMIIYGRGFSFSLDAIEMDDYGPFSGDGRIVHARSIFMMIIPLIWYLNQLIQLKKLKFLLPVFFCLTVILIHQHRSVWSSTFVALFFYFVASVINRRQNLVGILKILIIVLLGLAVVYFLLQSLNPRLMAFLADRFSEIFSPDKEGSTGTFRFEQRETYFKLFLQHPVFGWTFAGFEMPNPLVDWWPAMSGQHFHEGYMEMLFYHGVVGLLFKYSFMIYLLTEIFRKNRSDQTIILTSICIAGLIFSLSYVLPLVLWGHVGVCLYYIDRDRKAAKEEMEFTEVEDEYTPEINYQKLT